MKKIITLFTFLLLAGFSNAQQVSITIDTIYYLPAQPSVGDSIFLHLSGTANCHFIQQGPAFIADTGHLHTINVCYVGNVNSQPSTFAYDYGIFTAMSPGTDTLEWMFDYNKHIPNFCDTVLQMGVFYIQVSPAAVFSPHASPVSVSWNAYENMLTFDRLNRSGEFCLTDMSGRVIKREMLYDQRGEIKMAELQNGIYLVSITDKDGILYRDKIFIGHE